MHQYRFLQRISDHIARHKEYKYQTKEFQGWYLCGTSREKNNARLLEKLGAVKIQPERAINGSPVMFVRPLPDWQVARNALITIAGEREISYTQIDSLGTSTIASYNSKGELLFTETLHRMPGHKNSRTIIVYKKKMETPVTNLFDRVTKRLDTNLDTSAELKHLREMIWRLEQKAVE